MVPKLDFREGFRRIRQFLKWGYLVVVVVSIGATFNEAMHTYHTDPSGYGGVSLWDWTKFSTAVNEAANMLYGFVVFALVVFVGYRALRWIALGFLKKSEP